MPRKGLPNPGLMSSGGAHEAEVWDPRPGRGGRSMCSGSARGLHSLIGRVDDGQPVCAQPRAGHSARRREAVALGITFPSSDTRRLFPWTGSMMTAFCGKRTRLSSDHYMNGSGGAVAHPHSSPSGRYSYPISQMGKHSSEMLGDLPHM